MRSTAYPFPSFWCIICPRLPVGTLRFTKIDVFPIFSEMTENAHFCSKFKSNTNFKLRRTSQILFWHSQRSSKALNFENLCVNTLFLIEKSDFFAHFHLLKCSFSLQIQVQDHFWTQQSIPITILELSDLSWTFKKRISYINTHFLVQKSDIFAHFESLLRVLSTLIWLPSHPETS